MAYDLNTPISDSADSLSDKLFKLEEGGSTALGPAVVASVALASKANGSKVRGEERRREREEKRERRETRDERQQTKKDRRETEQRDNCWLYHQDLCHQGCYPFIQPYSRMFNPASTLHMSWLYNWRGCITHSLTRISHA